ncbi:MAG: hypothetical protein CM15mP83_6750 [Flavobacteriaceae bacterium]|nr:MAG: hypothetical protein CM15mP83_6750 [Flavobacteriaceae bacterium]
MDPQGISSREILPAIQNSVKFGKGEFREISRKLGLKKQILKIIRCQLAN